MSSNQYGVKEVADLVIRDYKTKKPLLFCDYAMTTTNENKASRIDLKGGRGNYVLMSFDHSRTSTLKIDMPLVDLHMVAILAGQELAIQEKDVFQHDIKTVKDFYKNTVTVTLGTAGVATYTVTVDEDEFDIAVTGTDTASTIAGSIRTAVGANPKYTVTGASATVVIVNADDPTKKVVVSGDVDNAAIATLNGVYSTNGKGFILNKTPLSGTLTMFELENVRDYGDVMAVTDDYTISGKVVTVVGTQAKVIADYMFTTSNTAKTIRVAANKFPNMLEVYGEGLFRDQMDDADYPVKMHAFKAKPKADMTFTMSGDKATELSIEFDLYPERQDNGDMALIDYTILSD